MAVVTNMSYGWNRVSLWLNVYSWGWTYVPIILEIVLRWYFFFWFLSSSSRTQVTAICSSEDDVEMILRQITIAIISIVINVEVYAVSTRSSKSGHLVERLTTLLQKLKYILGWWGGGHQGQFCIWWSSNERRLQPWCHEKGKAREHIDTHQLHT